MARCFLTFGSFKLYSNDENWLTNQYKLSKSFCEKTGSSRGLSGASSHLVHIMIMCITRTFDCGLVSTRAATPRVVGLKLYACEVPVTWLGLAHRLSVWYQHGRSSPAFQSPNLGWHTFRMHINLSGWLSVDVLQALTTCSTDRSLYMKWWTGVDWAIITLLHNNETMLLNEHVCML